MVVRVQGRRLRRGRYWCRGAGRSSRDADAARGGRVVSVAVVPRRRVAGRAVHLHVLPERGRVGVGLVAAVHAAIVGLVRRVHVGVLLPVRRVGEPAVAACVLALEGLFS